MGKRKQGGSVGTIIDNIIAIDVWNLKVLPDSVKFFFLTHCHADNTRGLDKHWSRGKIFTSKVNAKLLRHQLGSGVWSSICVLSLNKKYTIAKDRDGNDVLGVMLIDAHHVPGSVSLMFEGRAIGRVLYTGDFRSNQKYLQRLDKYKGNIDRCFLDNTFLSPDYDFDCVDNIIEQMVKFVKDHSAHRIYIGVKNLGKESALVKLAESLDEKICVSREKMSLFKLLHLPDVFTNDPGQARIFLLNQNVVTRGFIEEANQVTPSKGLIMTPNYHNWEKGPYSRCHEYNMHVFAHSDHSSYSELVEFVRHVKPKEVFPILKEAPQGILAQRQGLHQTRTDMSIFRELLSNEPKEKPLTGIIEECCVPSRSHVTRRNSCRERQKEISDLRNLTLCSDVPTPPTSDLAQRLSFLRDSLVDVMTTNLCDDNAVLDVAIRSKEIFQQILELL